MDAASTLEDNLMEIEMLLQDALGESTGKFKDRVVLMNKDMRDKSMDYIKLVGEGALSFHDNLKNAALVE